MIITTIVLVAVIVAMIVLLIKMPKSSCTGDCNQGRNCTCQNNTWSK